jgi:hypothetical protein
MTSGPRWTICGHDGNRRRVWTAAGVVRIPLRTPPPLARRTDAAYGTLRAVHYGMVQGLTPGQAIGWGQVYFANDYSHVQALERARETWDVVMEGGVDQVFVVPTEPLAKLATSAPQDGLIDVATVAVANFALWRVHVFNQLVRQLTDFTPLKTRVTRPTHHRASSFPRERVRCRCSSTSTA